MGGQTNRKWGETENAIGGKKVSGDTPPEQEIWHKNRAWSAIREVACCGYVTQTERDSSISEKKKKGWPGGPREKRGNDRRGPNKGVEGKRRRKSL